MTLRDQLEKLGACDESLEWVRGKTIKQAWETCENTSWMFWILIKTDLDIIDPVCDMAERVLHLISGDEQLVCSNFISKTRKRANKDESITAYITARAASTYYDDYAHNAACRCAVRAAYTACNSDYAADAAGYAARAAAASYLSCSSAYYAAYKKEQKKQCDILRKYFTIDQVKKALKKLVSQSSL